LGVNAYKGEHGSSVMTSGTSDRNFAQLTVSSTPVKSERAVWQRRFSMIKSDNIGTPTAGRAGDASARRRRSPDLTVMRKRR